MKILLAGDLHYTQIEPILPEKRGKLAAHLLRRLVNRANRFIHPDVLILVGDIIDSPMAVNASELLKELRLIINEAEMPVLVVPGNHDPSADKFYQIMPQSADFLEINGVRLVPFARDPEQPGFNAWRSKSELARLEAARHNFNGPLVTIQHVPVLPAGATGSPYNYTNSTEILSQMCAAGVTLSLAGHYHLGHLPFETDKLTFVTVGALSETPFPYEIIEIKESGEIKTVTEYLKLPEGMAFYDYHLHTPLAYCNENMDPSVALDLAHAFGLSRIGFAEHSGHLYCSRQDYGRRNIWYYQGLNFPERLNRAGEYFEMLREFRGDFCRVGMEIDICRDGSLLLDTADSTRLDFRLGAIHHLPECTNGASDAEVEAELLRLTEGLLAGGVDMVAHPLRVISWAKRKIPDGLPLHLANLLKKYSGVAELNFHHDQPSGNFVLACLENGVKFSFGGDAHNLYEIGEFYGHLAMIDKLAPGLMITDVLAPPIGD